MSEQRRPRGPRVDREEEKLGGSGSFLRVAQIHRKVKVRRLVLRVRYMAHAPIFVAFIFQSSSRTLLLTYHFYILHASPGQTRRG